MTGSHYTSGPYTPVDPSTGESVLTVQPSQAFADHCVSESSDKESNQQLPLQHPTTLQVSLQEVCRLTSAVFHMTMSQDSGPRHLQGQRGTYDVPIPNGTLENGFGDLFISELQM